MKRSLSFIALAVLILALAAFQCNISIGGTPQPTAPPPPTDTPVQAATNTPVTGGFSLQDDFSDNRNGWFVAGPDTAGNELAVRDGAYHIRSIFEQDADTFQAGWTTVWSFTDFDLKIEATQVEGTDNNEIAVVFGAADADNFYEFAYSGDGFFMLGRYQNGDWEFIQQWDTSDAIILGDAANDVRLVVENGNLTAFINGEEVMISEVPDYAGGFIGFGCGPFEAPEAHCAFDNLEVGELS